MELLFARLKAYALLSEALKDHLTKILREHEFSKGHVILREGDTCRRIYFIVSGRVQITCTPADKEVTVWLLKARDFFFALDSFYNQVPSDETHVVLTPMVAYSITFEELIETIRLFPEFLLHESRIKGDYYNILQQREKAFKGATPVQKYQWLLKNNPEAIAELPPEVIYTYLDISKYQYNQARDAVRNGSKNK